ncbi:phosphopantetheine-binding protein [Paenibacillus filicis]|uniref:Phosphopantetheine-binding protein n=1 Tax=Paenibacillus gyeongsangnamensis TaxID=3388067 RepID=A0ABT4Q8F9_9BACL|nr:phosphopantetheine-binding protein [Paenibacillus filicis]MCZ8513161.1 phosphopantetheine-binding protein [Paenibacillus filicis]
MKSLEEIKNTIKQSILIDRLELEDITAEEIEDNAPLFGEGLGLDSVEALDVVAGLEAEFGVKLQGMDQEEIKKHFYSVETLSQFVSDQLALLVK